MAADAPSTPAVLPGATPASLAGEILHGRYRLVELLGDGTGSRVFKAIDLEVADEGAPPAYVAVKILRRSFTELNRSFAALDSQIEKLRSLTHPHIVRLFEGAQDGAQVFFAMEYCGGGSLRERMRSRGSIDADPAAGANSLTIIAAIAAALAYAHAAGVVHGDVEPGNVLFDEKGEAKLGDFANASWAAGQEPSVRYASPQAAARLDASAADDVYSLACIAYELLTGRHPFETDFGEQKLIFPPPHAPQLTSSQYAALVNALRFERGRRTQAVRRFMRKFGAPAPDARGTSRGWAIAGAAVITAAVVAWSMHRAAPERAVQPAHVSASPRTPAAATPAAAPRAQLPRLGAVPHTPVPSAAADVSAMRVPAPDMPREAISGAGLTGRVLQDCAACPPMKVLPAGQFVQGSSDPGAPAFERPQRTVTLARPIAMSVHEATVAELRRFIAATGRDMRGCDVYDGAWQRRPDASWKRPGFAQDERHPATCVSWDDAVAYARWLSATTGHRYRLPSAAEWEYAARSGSASDTPWDAGGTACGAANVADESAARRYPGWQVFQCNDGYTNTAPVGMFKANAFGLYDMLGNVFVWTQDCWHADYVGAPVDGAPRTNPLCTDRELRGGSWFSAPAYVRYSYRNHFDKSYRASSVGLRLVRELDR